MSVTHVQNTGPNVTVTPRLTCHSDVLVDDEEEVAMVIAVKVESLIMVTAARDVASLQVH